MSKKRDARRPVHHEEWHPEEKKRPLVVRVGIAILGIAVAISSLIPMLSFFQR